MGWDSSSPYFYMKTDSQNFSLVQAGLKDLFDLRLMEKVCFPQDAWPLIELIGVLTLPDVVRIKAVHKDRMLGFVAGDVRSRRKEGWIASISVLPEFQRRGIARALLDACEQQMGMPIVKLSVRKTNYGAQVLYQKLGYHQEDVWEKYYPGGEDGIVFSKRILKFM